MPPSPPEAPNDLVCVAAVAAAHGVRGAVRLRAFTDDPLSVAAYGPLFDGRGRAYGVRVLHPVKGGVVAALDGIADRDAAEALRGVRLYVPRDALPPPDEDEWYPADLIGLAVVGPDGAAFGRVTAVSDFGAGDVIEWQGEGKEGMVPFTRAHVPLVDVAGGRLVVDPAAIEPYGEVPP